jgi:16S rRNA (cytosine1402-N4)-methyltransferase
MNGPKNQHVPVMLSEVLEALAPRDGAYYVDGTFGGGGYAGAILEAADCRVLGVDRDPDAIARGRALAAHFGGRLTLVQGEFSRMDEFTQAGDGMAKGIDGVVLDLGVSSFQFDQPARGFSFREDGPLDMRMSLSGESAADFVNTTDERTLSLTISRYGEEKNARRIARAIIAARPITGTAQLAAIVSQAQGPAALRHAIHPATRTFQALRIHVNDELGELERGLDAALKILKPEGRLVVVSFHSLEDRIVKRFLSTRSTTAPRASRHSPVGAPARAAAFQLLARRTPSASELSDNPRARSAKLRAGIKLAA